MDKNYNRINKLGQPMPRGYDMQALAIWAYPDVEVPKPGEHIAAVTWDVGRMARSAEFGELQCVAQIVFWSRVKVGATLAKGVVIPEDDIGRSVRTQNLLAFPHSIDADAFCKALRPLIIGRERLAGRLHSEDIKL